MEINKKILASMVIIGLLALALGWGTHSWFSDTETSTENTFTAGTLNIKLTGGTPAEDGVTGTWTADNWAPGEIKTATLTVTNVGSIGGYSFYFGISAISGDLCPQIHVTEFLVSLTGTYNHVDWMATVGPWDNTGPLTLAEFGRWAGTDSPYGFMIWGDGGALPSQGSLTVTMTLLFNPDAETQGQSCSFDVKVGAYQEGYPLYIVQVGGDSPSYGNGY